MVQLVLVEKHPHSRERSIAQKICVVRDESSIFLVDFPRRESLFHFKCEYLLKVTLSSYFKSTLAYTVDGFKVLKATEHNFHFIVFKEDAVSLSSFMRLQMYEQLKTNACLELHSTISHSLSSGCISNEPMKMDLRRVVLYK